MKDGVRWSMSNSESSPEHSVVAPPVWCLEQEQLASFAKLLRPGGVMALNCISDPTLTPSLVALLAAGLTTTRGLYFDLFAAASPSHCAASRKSNAAAAAAGDGAGEGVGPGGDSLAVSRERILFARHRCKPVPSLETCLVEQSEARADLAWALSLTPSLVENPEGWISSFVKFN